MKCLINRINFRIALGILTIFSLLAPFKPAYTEEYKRIVSLAPSVTESLYLLGLREKVLAITIYCPNPDNLDKIGTTLEPNIEKIVYLQPDLVLACKEANRLKTLEKLESLGINVFVVEESKNFSDICRNFLLLGRVVGRRELAERIVAEAKEDLELFSQRVAGFTPLKVFWEIGARPLITINRESFVDEIIKFSGGTNIFSDLKSKYPRISYEEVLRRNPDVIVLITMGDVSDKEVLRWKRYKHIRAARDNRIYIMDSSLVCWPIPPNFVQSVKQVSTLLHPEIIQSRE